MISEYLNNNLEEVRRMKNIRDFIFRMKDLGVNINLQNGDLRIEAPKNVLTSEIVSEIRSSKVDILDFFSKSSIDSLYDSYTLLKPANLKDWYPLSSGQKRLYMLQQMGLDLLTYNMPFTIHLSADVDKRRVEEVFRKLISRHESLRTSFEIQGDVPVQRIHDEISFSVDVFPVEKSEVLALRNRFVKPFDLSQAPLLRVAIVEIQGENQLLLLDMHHIISDGVSCRILEGEFQRLYRGQELPTIKTQYKDYSEWQNSEEHQAKVKEQEVYWIERFEGEIPVLNLPTDYTRPNVQSHEGATVNFALNKEDTNVLRSLTETNGLTLYMSILSVFTLLLSKLSGQEDIVIGTPIAGRNHADLEQIVGMFVNTLAIRNKVEANDTFKGLTERVKQNTLEAFDNQDYQFEELVERVSISRDISRNPIFDVMFNLLNQEEYSHDLSGFDELGLIHTSGVSKFDLSLTVVDCGEQLQLSVEYCTKLFKGKTIERFIGYFKQVVKRLASGSEIEISELELLSTEEKHQLLCEFNETESAYPKNKTIHQLFEEQVTRTPQNIAVITRDRSITYNELRVMSEKLAGVMQSKGVMSASIVGIMLDRSVEMVVGIMGILKAGCSYLPITPNTPTSRLEFILRDSESKLVLTQTKYQDKLSALVEGFNLENLESFSYTEQCSQIEYSSNALAYIIYTSGTTGNPKGVMIENHSVVNRLKWMQKKYPIGSGDVILQKTPFTFDVSVWELFWWSLEGGSVYMLDPEGEKDAELIARTIGEHRINVVHFVPSMLETFLDVIGKDSKEYDFGSIKYVFSSGESLKPHQVNGFYKLFAENKQAKLINLYGPTEATVDVSYYDCTRDADNRVIPIGMPIDNTQLYILNKESLKVQPIGVVGELMISGVGLSRGYVNKEELTVEKFISHPFKEGERLYCTGDLARWLPDGNIEFLGRMDHQVKIRGFRIELGDIESTLIKHENVKESIVLVREENGDNYLCAYVVCKGEEKNLIHSLQNYLSGLLPDYMIPSYILRIDKIPLTSNGKIDRRSLPKPEIKSESDYIAPQNDIEKKLCEIWQEVLGLKEEQISTHIEFFRIGGNSLKIIKLLSLIKNSFITNLTIYDLFQHNTIIKMAQLIDQDGLLETSINAPFIRLNRNAKRDVYCFPPSLGLGIWCSKLVPYTNDFTLISFNFINKENLPAYYADLIINDSPFSDKILMGFSAGGNLAYEVAKALELKNSKVTDIIFIDSIKWTEENIRKVLTKEKIEAQNVFNVLKENNLSIYIEKVYSIISAYSSYIVNTNNSDIVNANIHNIICEGRLPNNRIWALSTRGQYFEYNGIGPHTEMAQEPYLKHNAELLNSILQKLYCNSL